jgi:hypothetical protein
MSAAASPTTTISFDMTHLQGATQSLPIVGRAHEAGFTVGEAIERQLAASSPQKIGAFAACTRPIISHGCAKRR